MNVLITGGKGFLARNLKPLFEKSDFYGEIYAPGREELDLTEPFNLADYLLDHKIDAVIHTAIRGGNRTDKDTHEDFVDNVTMFENLVQHIDPKVPIITFGSGAEFDRRRSIKGARENDVFKSWPVDFYGLAKNLITRRGLIEHSNCSVLRLFGCFHPDEEKTRFITSCVDRLKRGLLPHIDIDRAMDFFYLDDVFTVIDYILKRWEYRPHPFHLNLVYEQKYSLLQIAMLISKEMGKPSSVLLGAYSNVPATEYTGDGWTLHDLNLDLIGLEGGIRKMI